MDALNLVKIILETACYCCLFFTVWKPRFKLKWMTFFILPQLAFSLTSFLFYLNTTAYTIALCAQFAFICFFFVGSLFKKIFFFGIYIITLFFSEIVALAYVVFVLGKPIHTVTIGSPVRQSALVVYMICMVCVFSIVILFFKRKKIALSGRQWALYALIPLSNFMLFAFYMTDGFRAGNYNLFMIFAVFITAFIGNFFLLQLFREIAVKNKLEARSYFIERQLEDQYSHYVALNEQIQLTQKYRHDILNHMDTIGILLERDNYTEAQQYAQRLKQQCMQMKTVMLCNDPVIDAMLYSKYQTAAEHGIQFDISFTLPPALPVATIDLVGAVSNLLDNSLEACMHLQPTDAAPYIRVVTTVRANVFVVQIENNCTVKPKVIEKKLKPPALSFGIGLDIVREICKKNNGTLTLQEDNAQFTSTLSFLLL